MPDTPVRLSVLETGGLFGRALQAAGMPAGAVDAAVAMLQWTEIHRGGAIAELARTSGTLGEGIHRSRPEPHEAEPGRWRIDAEGTSALLLGPGLLDVACVGAHRHGLGVGVARDVVDLAYVGQLAALGASRGFVGLVVQQRGAPGADAGDTILAAIPDGAAPALITWRHGDPAGPDAPAIERIEELLTTHLLRDNDRRALGVVCTTTEPLGSILRQHPAAVPGEAVAARRAAAYADGLQVAEADWRALAEFGYRTLVRASERSRRAAGF